MEDKVNKKILITGTAGFIGFHLANFLNARGFEVVGIDGMTSYYDLKLKQDRHETLKKNSNFYSYEILLEDKKSLSKIFKKHKPQIVIHLAAQAGVRYSLENPKSYLDCNIIGTFNLLEEIKNNEINHLLIASTSSVYGTNKQLPFKETDNCNMPISFYASTKIATEAISHSYSYLYRIPTTIFRFFTVYGPWGRPDMALFKFTKAMLNDKSIDVFNNGRMKRDFTYIDDIVYAIYLLMNKSPDKTNNKINSCIKNDSLSDFAPWRVINIGNSKSIELSRFISMLEKKLQKKAKKNFLPLQPGDVVETFSDISLLKTLTGFVPKTDISKGIDKFLDWYKSYY